MKILSVARKTLREDLREPLLLALLLLFPAMLVLLYFYAFPTDQGMARYLKLLVVNQDAGPAGAALVQALRDANLDGKPVFNVELVANEKDAAPSLRERKAALLLVIPPGFNQALQPGSQPAAPLPLRLVGDQAADMYAFGSSFVAGSVEAFVDAAAGWKQARPLAYEFIKGTGSLSDFQFGVPGVLVFGVMFAAITTALIFTREHASGALKRLKLSRLSAFELMSGVLLAEIVETAVQIPLTFWTAQALGFKSPGSLLLAMGIGMLVCLTATSAGLMTACFSKTDSEAVNISTIFLFPLVFLSGAIFPMPPVPLGSIAGRTINLYDLLPTTHAAEALRRVMIYGDGPAQIAYSLIACALLSVLYLLLGAWIYQRLRLRKAV